MSRTDGPLSVPSLRIAPGGADDCHIQAVGRSGDEDAFLLGVFPDQATPAALRYNDVLTRWEIRVVGGVYEPIATPAGSIDLTIAYQNGDPAANTIPITTALGTIELENSTSGENQQLLRLSNTGTVASLVGDAGGVDTFALFGSGDLALGVGSMSAGERLRVSGDALVEGDASITGNATDLDAIQFDEQSASPIASAAGKGVLWVRDDTPNVLVFTDDTGADTVLGAGGGGGGTLDDAYDFGGAGAGRTIEVAAGAVELDVRQTSGTSLDINYGAATVAAGSITAIDLDLSTNLTGGANTIRGIDVLGPNTTIGSSSLARFRATQVAGLAPIVDITTTGFTPTGAYTGMRITLNNLGSNAFQVQGINITLGDTSSATSRLLSLSTLQTAGQHIKSEYAGATTLTGQAIGLFLDMQTNVTPGANAVRGVLVDIPASTAALTAAFSAISRQTIGSIYNAVVGAATTLTGDYFGADLDIQTNVTAGTEIVRGVRVRMPDTENTSSVGVAVESIQEGGALFKGSFSAATTLADVLSGMTLDLDTNVGAGAIQVRGLTMLLPSTTNSTSAGILVSSDQRAGDYINLSGTATLTGILDGIDINMGSITTSGNVTRAINIVGAPNDAAASRIIDITQQGTIGTLIEVTSGTVTLTGDMTGIALDLNTNVTAGANQVIGIDLSIPGSTDVGTRSIDIDTRQTAGTIVEMGADGVVTTTGDLIALDIDLDTNYALNPSDTFTGIRFRTTNQNNAGNRALDMGIRFRQGIWMDFNVPAGISLDGDLTGLKLDLQSNITSTGGNAVIGMDMLIAEGGSTSTRAIQVDTRQTAGVWVDFSVGAAISLSGGVTLMSLDGRSNVTAGLAQTFGIDVDVPPVTDNLIVRGKSNGAITSVLFHDGDLVLGGLAMSGTERLRVVGDARVEGKLTVTGLIDPTGLLLDEQASSPTAPAAGEALLWIRNDAPNTLVFTNDEGVDIDISTLALAGYVSQARTQTTSVSTLTIGTAGVESNVADSTGTHLMTFTGTLSADITASGAGGLDTGSEASSTWYAIHVIGDTTGANSPDALLSTSATAPTLPSGYDVFRRVGWVRNNGSSDFRLFQQSGTGNFRQVVYTDSILTRNVLSGGANTFPTVSVDLSSVVPPTSQRAAIHARENGTADAIFGIVAAGTITDGLQDPNEMEWVQPLTSTQTMAYGHLSGGGSLDIWVLQYEDWI